MKSSEIASALVHASYLSNKSKKNLFSRVAHLWLPASGFATPRSRQIVEQGGREKGEGMTKKSDVGNQWSFSRRISHSQHRWKSGVLILSVLVLGLVQTVRAEHAAYVIDFTDQPDGPASQWLKAQGFTFRLDADALRPHFKDHRLVLQTDRQNAGLFERPLDLPGITRIRIRWGVERFPQGADWDNGTRAVALAVMTSFGTEKLSSGALYIPNAPYFIGLFLGEREQPQRAYTGRYYTLGGRYFCTTCPAPLGKTVVTEFDLAQTFKEQFATADLPPVSRFGFQMNTKGTRSGATAFLEKIEYLATEQLVSLP